MSAWEDCPECDARTRSKNLERHVREKHPRNYIDHYPDAPAEHGVAPCGVCWEWLGLDPVTVEVDGHETASVPEHMHHMAAEHPAEFDDEYPGECLLCALGLTFPVYPPVDEVDPDAASFIYSSKDDSMKWDAAAAWLSGRAGVAVTEEEAREHTRHVDTAPIVRESPVGTPLMVMDDYSRRCFIPTKLEMDLIGATEPGDEMTVAEIARAADVTKDGARKRLDDMLHRRLLELVDEGRPAVYRRLGADNYPDRASWEERRERNDRRRENWTEGNGVSDAWATDSWQERPGLGFEGAYKAD